MTTIAYKDGCMAADSGMSDGGMIVANKHPKVAANIHGDLAGVCGSAAFSDLFLDWFRAGEKGDRPEAIADTSDEAIIARVDGRLELYQSRGLIRIDHDYYAIGSGYKLAMGVMWNGGGAIDAVVCGIEHDVYTRGPVLSMRHPKNAKR